MTEKLEFKTLEEMVEFYEENKDKYILTWGETAKLYERVHTKYGYDACGEMVAEIIDERAGAMALEALKRMIKL